MPGQTRPLFTQNRAEMLTRLEVARDVLTHVNTANFHVEEFDAYHAAWDSLDDVIELFRFNGTVE